MQKTQTKGCNCQKKEECPIPGECNQTNVVYQVEIKAENKIMKYFGSTEDFKKRYSSHKSSINNPNANQTTYSSYVRSLKDKKVPYETNWSIRSKGHAFSSGS